MSLISKAGDLLLSPFGGAPDTPKVTAPAVDAETNALINKQVDRAKRSTADIVKEDMTGVKEAGAVFDPNSATAAADDERMRAASGYQGDPTALDAAIRRKQGAAYAGDINKIEREANLNAPAKRQAALTQASTLVASKNNYDQSVAKMNYQAKLDAQAARSGALSSILGIGGTVAGAVFGGPAGAAVGGQLGSAAGGMIGSAG